jgi:Bifunctional DNA primase/polymerase, N-terminal
MPPMKYLRFYLDRKCVVMPGFGKTKNTRKGCGSWTWWQTKDNIDWLKRNAKVRNGTGGLLIVDIDPKNGGSVESLRQRFPDLPETRTVHTVTQHPNGPGVHLIFTIPRDVVVATNRALGTGIDVPDAVMLPGSIYRGDDGVDRTYTLVKELEPAPAPLALIAAVDRGQASDQTPPLDPGDTDGIVAALLAKFAAAGPGERNPVFTEVALPVLRARGDEGADLLRYAYPGDDDEEFEQMLNSAMQKAGMSASPMSRLRSRYVEQWLQSAWQSVRYGQWSKASDRKVVFAVVSMCSSMGGTTTPAVSFRDLALRTGIETKTVAAAVSRLIETGVLHVVRTTDDGRREYTPIEGEMTTVSSKGDSPLRGVPVDPLHDVWLSSGLTGRHSHVFDLVDVGHRKASKVAVAGGMGRDTARDALKALEGVGLLQKEGTVYTVPIDVVDTADRLAVDHGGKVRRANLTARISEERARPRGDAQPVADNEGIDNDDEYDRRRREEDDELMRQVGML